MRSPVRKRLASALAAAAVALALTSCTSSPRAPSSAAATARAASATSQTLKQRAEKAAEAILASVPMPAGGDRPAAPLSLSAPPSPSIYVVAAWQAHLTAYLEAPGSPRAVLAWEVAHVPRAYTAVCGSPGPPPWS
jgi:hypothetical protein